MDLSSSYIAINETFGCTYDRRDIFRAAQFSGNSFYDEVQLFGLNLRALCDL